MVELLGIAEAAAALHISPVTVRRAWIDGRLSGVRIGRLVRFLPETILAVSREGLPPPPPQEKKQVPDNTEAPRA